jgi:hypothetical protein
MPAREFSPRVIDCGGCDGQEFDADDFGDGVEINDDVLILAARYFFGRTALQVQIREEPLALPVGDLELRLGHVSTAGQDGVTIPAAPTTQHHAGCFCFLLATAAM